MSKKIMKRSLALGALMAFVITGSAWAETITKDYINRHDNEKGGAINISKKDYDIENSKFENNSSTGTFFKGEGGAIYIREADVTLKNNEFINNSASYWGGAITLSYYHNAQNEGSVVTLKGANVFDSNFASDGGAISVEAAVLNFGDKSGTGIEDYTLFENNKAIGGVGAANGGAIYIYYDDRSKTEDEAQLNFYSDVEFKNNFAKNNGGAICNERTLGEINFIKGTTTFVGNQSGVKFNKDNTVKEVGTPNDIFNAGTINIGKEATVLLDGGINGGRLVGSTVYNGTINIAGLLNGVVTSSELGSSKKVAAQNVVLKEGVWDLSGKSQVNTLSTFVDDNTGATSTGTLKVDLIKGEQVKVLSANSDAKASNYDFSKINIDHGGVVGVNIKQGVENFYNTIVDANDKSLIKDKQVGDIFLQANVQVKNDEVTTTIKPGDKLVVESDLVADSFNGVKIEDLAKTEYVNTALAAKADKATTLAGYGIADAYTKGEVNIEMNKKANQDDVEAALDLKADKTALEAEATTREKADVGLQEQIDNLSTGSNEAIAGVNQRLGKMNGKINKVGAGAAALAALHPLEYDPDDKLTFSAGVGNYDGENAAALGAFYRPDEKFMVSLGGTMGNGENMVNLGISVGLDGANGTPKLSRKELVEKVNTMEAENANMKAEIAELKAMVAELAKKK